MSSSKGGKMASIIGYRVKVTLNDSRTLTGQMLAFDKHMNLVLSECEEFRRLKLSKAAKKAKTVIANGGETNGDEDEEEEEMKRMLGLVILRGETIVTLSVEGPPPAENEGGMKIAPGPGMGAPAGRGMGLSTPTMRMAPQNFAPPPGMPGMMPPPGFAPPGFPMAPPPGFQGR